MRRISGTHELPVVFSLECRPVELHGRPGRVTPGVLSIGLDELVHRERVIGSEDVHVDLKKLESR